MRYLAPAVLAILALALVAPAAPADAASFDCGQAGTEIERTICGDEALSGLDELLGDRYVRARAKTDDAMALRTEQRAWLRDVRNGCADAACLKAACEARIAELTKIGWMTNEKARAICEEVRNAVNDGTLQQRFVEFEPLSYANSRPLVQGSPFGERYWITKALAVDYDSDGKLETLGMFAGGGTCGSAAIADVVSEHGRLFIPYYDRETRSEYEDLRWVYWGNSEHFLTVAGEPVVVTGRFGEKRQVGLVSWLAPDGSKLALCSLARTADVVIRSNAPGGNEALCRAVADMEVDYVPWTVATPISAEAYNSQRRPGFDGAYGADRDVNVRSAALDFDLDGETDYVAQMDYPSSAGCGWDAHWIVEVDPPTKSTTDSAIAGLYLGPMNFRMLDNPHRDAPLSAFKFEGKPYIHAGDAVLSFWGGKQQTQCEFERFPQHRITGHYPLDGWPNRPTDRR